MMSQLVDTTIVRPMLYLGVGMVATGESSGNVVIYRLRDGEMARCMEGHSRAVWGIYALDDTMGALSRGVRRFGSCRVRACLHANLFGAVRCLLRFPLLLWRRSCAAPCLVFSPLSLAPALRCSLKPETKRTHAHTRTRTHIHARAANATRRAQTRLPRGRLTKRSGCGSGVTAVRCCCCYCALARSLFVGSAALVMLGSEIDRRAAICSPTRPLFRAHRVDLIEGCNARLRTALCTRTLELLSSWFGQLPSPHRVACCCIRIPVISLPVCIPAFLFSRKTERTDG